MEREQVVDVIIRIILHHYPSTQGIYLFGSYQTEDEWPDSDVDILIELERPPKIGLIGLIELQEHLGDLLDAPADVVIKSNLRKRIGQRILREVIPVRTSNSSITWKTSWVP